MQGVALGRPWFGWSLQHQVVCRHHHIVTSVLMWRCRFSGQQDASPRGVFKRPRTSLAAAAAHCLARGSHHARDHAVWKGRSAPLLPLLLLAALPDQPANCLTSCCCRAAALCRGRCVAAPPRWTCLPMAAETAGRQAICPGCCGLGLTSWWCWGPGTVLSYHLSEPSLDNGGHKSATLFRWRVKSSKG